MKWYTFTRNGWQGSPECAIADSSAVFNRNQWQVCSGFCILLIDDKKGRKIAKLNDIKIIGSLGVLILAKSKNLIHEIRPLMTRLQKLHFKKLKNDVSALVATDSQLER